MRRLAWLTAVSLLLAQPAGAEQAVGVVTAVAGAVVLARGVESQPQRVHLEHELFSGDRIATGSRAITRMLLGGRILVTARERTALTVRAAAGGTTIDLATGGIAVIVDRERMRAADVVKIRTADAVVTLPAETLVVEVDHRASTFTSLAARVDVLAVSRDSVTVLEPPVALGVRQALSVKRGGRPSRPRPVTTVRASALLEEFTPPRGGVSTIDTPGMDDQFTQALKTLSATMPGMVLVPPPSPITTAPGGASASAPSSSASGPGASVPGVPPGHGRPHHGPPSFASPSPPPAPSGRGPAGRN